MTDSPIFRIYKIYSKSDKDSIIYYGSTTLTIDHRFRCHKNAYTSFTKNRARYCSSFDLFQRYDMSSIVMEEIEKPKTAQIMKIREHFYITNFYCCNVVIPRLLS